MFTIRDIITEALARSNLVPRRQPAPGKMVESAYQLLKGIAATYSKQNLLQFLRREVDLTDLVIKETQYILSDYYTVGRNFWYVVNGNTGVLPNPMTVTTDSLAWDNGVKVWRIVEQRPSMLRVWSETTYGSRDEAAHSMYNSNGVSAFSKEIPGGMQPTLIIGTVDPELKGDWVNVVVDDIAAVTEVYWDRTAEENLCKMVPLQFVSYEDFNNGAYGDLVYTYQPITDRKVELRFKPLFLRYLQGASKRLIMVFNVAYDFDLNSTLRIPEIYKELFETALTYKLACEFPRLSPEHTERLKTELDDIKNSVKSPTRANKFVTRPVGCTNRSLNTMAQLDSGAFIFPG